MKHRYYIKNESIVLFNNTFLNHGLKGSELCAAMTRFFLSKDAADRATVIIGKNDKCLLEFCLKNNWKTLEL